VDDDEIVLLGERHDLLEELQIHRRSGGLCGKLMMRSLGCGHDSWKAASRFAKKSSPGPNRTWRTSPPAMITE